MTPASLVRSLLDPNRSIPGEKADERQVRRGLEELGEKIERSGIRAGAESADARFTQDLLAFGGTAGGLGLSVASKLGLQGVENDSVQKLTEAASTVLSRSIEVLEERAAQKTRMGDDLAAAARGARSKARA